MTPSGHELTQLLHQWGKGDRAALDELMPLVYRELHKMAKRYMRQQEPSNTLQTTAVIHEAYLKLVGTPERDWEDRTHFFAVAAMAMRHVLVDHARRVKASKRGGDVRIVPLEDGLAADGGLAAEITALDDALNALAQLDQRKSRVVELRYFGGLSVEETAKTLNVSPETVARDWRLARAFLKAEMERDGPPA